MGTENKLWEAMRAVTEAMSLTQETDPAFKDCMEGAVSLILSVIGDNRKAPKDGGQKT